MFHKITLCIFLICALECGQTAELHGSGTLRSLNKRVTSSSQHPDAEFNVSHAVDGSTRRDSAQCNCCAATNQENDPWIQIDLGRQYRVAIVEVVGRKDFDDLFNMAIYVSTTNTMWQVIPPTQPTLPDVPEQYHNVTFSYPVIGQFVTLKLKGYVALYVCEVNIYSKDTLISLNAIVRASSIHPYSKFALSRAVDGSTSMNSTACRCCAATGRDDQPWIQINLGRLYRVAKVEVVSRIDWASTTYFAGMHIYLHENRDNWTLNHALVRTIPDDGSRYYILDNPVIAHYVTLQIPENNFLVVCEVSVFSSDCSPGTFGLYCNETCGQCQNGQMCDQMTGRCKQCLIGYHYPLCNTVCPHGSFGSNCSSTCHCQGNLTCDHVNGSCPDGKCDLGWHGSNCSQECDNMTYGTNCSKQCGHCYKESCDRRTGECSPCYDGYTGSRCMEGIIRLSAAAGMQVSMSSVHAGMDATKAIDGQLVDDPETCGCCSETTNEYNSWWQVDLRRPFFLKKVIVYGRLNENIFRQLVGFTILTSLTDGFPDNQVHIQTGAIQDSKVVAILPDVAARYVRIQRVGILTLCEVELVPLDVICPVYTYGKRCAACGACKNGSCDRVTGICPSGCFDGYMGDRCETLSVQQQRANTDVINRVIGAGVGVVTSCLVFGLIVAVFCYKKQRIRIYEQPSVRWEIETTKESAYATLENQEAVLRKEGTYDNPMKWKTLMISFINISIPHQI